jgi:YD repeat-containing protein
MKMLTKLNIYSESKFLTSLLGGFFCVGLFGVPSLAHAAKQPCADNFEVFANTQVQTIEMNGICSFSVHPRNSEQLLYRDFLFDTEGLVMIFDSYGQGSESETTAAREFHFFPRIQPMTYAYNAETRRLNITMPNGKIFSIDAVKSILMDVSGTQTKLNYDITPASRGGLEIQGNDGLFMDGGYARGHSPSQNSKDKIIFKDRFGNDCRLANGDVYNYDGDGDTMFKFNDDELADYLKSECPQLKP